MFIFLLRRIIPFHTKIRESVGGDFGHKTIFGSFCLNIFKTERLKKLRGTIVNFNPLLVKSDRYIMRLAKGSLGGKGRGMAFLSHFNENIDFSKLIPDLNIRIPTTAVIGALQFDKFLESNNLYEEVYSTNDFELTKKRKTRAREMNEK